MEKNMETLDKEQYLIFKVSDENYGLKLTKSKEIIKPTKVTNVPNSNDYILGVMNLRGQVIPVVHFKNKLGLDDGITDDYLPVDKEKKIIVVNVRDMLLGLYVDEVEEVIKLSEDEIETVFETRVSINEDYIEGVSIVEDLLVVILDLEKALFNDLDM